MATNRYGHIWSAWNVDEEDGVLTDLFLIDGNSTLRKSGGLVMNSTMSSEASRRFSVHSLPSVLGRQVSELCHPVDEKVGGIIYSDYNILISPKWEPGKNKLGVIQTKRWMLGDDDPELTVASLKALSEWVIHASVKMGREPIIHLACPGYGRSAAIRAAAKELPDCVYVWYPDSRRPLPLPNYHALYGIITMPEEEFATRFSGRASMQKLYVGIDDTANGRLIQYLAMIAYEEAERMHAPDPETSARHVSLSQFLLLKSNYARIAG